MGTLQFRQPWFGTPQKELTWILLMLGSPFPLLHLLPVSIRLLPLLASSRLIVDGATGVGGGKSCIGVVIWDSSGFPIGALSLVLPSSFPAETTEAYALLHGVLFAFEMQVHQALFESDALSIIHDLISKVPGSDFGHILEDIRVASSSFSFCSFHHLERDGNRAAHSLALEAKCSGQSKTWRGIPPPCIQDILSDDLL